MPRLGATRVASHRQIDEKRSRYVPRDPVLILLFHSVRPTTFVLLLTRLFSYNYSFF